MKAYEHCYNIMTTSNVKVKVKEKTTLLDLEDKQMSKSELYQ